MPDTSLAQPPSAPDHIPAKQPQQQQQPSSISTPPKSSPATSKSPAASASRPSTPGSKRSATAGDAQPNKGKEPATAASSTSSRPGSSSAEKPKDRPTTAELHLDQYISRDLLHSSALASQHAQSIDLIRSKRTEAEFYAQLRVRERNRNPGAVFGYGYAGYGNGFTDGPSRVLYPLQRKRPGGRKARELRPSRTQLQEQADQTEMLVPVRLDIDFDKIKLRDTFTWNMHERMIPPDLFAEQLVEDFHLPLNQTLVHRVTNAITEQVTDYYPHVFLADEPLDPMLPYTAYKNDDMRVLIKLNITIGQHTLVDQFEWDINNPLNSPEEFAMLMTRELSLSGEFTTAIAHSIREQCQLFTKALYVTNHPFDGRPIEDEDVRTTMLQSPIPSVFRPYISAKEYSPLLYVLSENDLDRAEKSQSREQRRLKRRVNRRGGPTIPDLKDMPKTHRTQIVSSVLPGAVAKITDLERSMQVKQVKDGESEEEDSESDAEDLPPEKTIPGFNNMTRRQKLAALNAQKANSQARSQTPEVHSRPDRAERYAERLRNETPMRATPVALFTPLPRRPGVPLPQESALLRISVHKEKYRKWAEDQRRRDALKAIQEQQAQKQQQQQEQQAVSMPPPPATPAQQPVKPTPVPAPAATQTQQSQPATAAGTPQTQPPQAPAEAPPAPPEWLSNALAALRTSYAHDKFEATIRKLAFDPVTGESIQQAVLQANPGREVKWKWIPRIRCNDCPGKLYNPGPEKTVESFLVHVKNRGHRERVDQRIQAEKARAA